MIDKEELAERVAIKMDSDIPEHEARRQAIAEQKKRFLENRDIGKNGELFK